MTRFFEWFQFGMLASLAAAALTRAVMLSARGTNVIVIDRQRTPPQMALDACLVLCLGIWIYEIVAHAWHFRFHVGPAIWHRDVVGKTGIGLFGAVAGVTSLALYVTAVVQLGRSWRLGIDRHHPGPLVTRGLFGWMRHPIYAALDLAFIGSFLTLGCPIFLFLAIAVIPLLHAVMLREERFLMGRYGDAYRAYCRRVGRYGSWRRGWTGKSN